MNKRSLVNEGNVNYNNNRVLDETPKAVPVVVHKNGEFIYDEKALKDIIQMNNVENLPLSVISIAGAFRKGKSFFLNMLLRYLNSKDKDNWLYNENKILKGFSWRGGSEPETKGILVWNQVFKTTGPDGKEVAVMIIDTQGAFDGDSSVKEYTTIFALSTLLSSIQIFNLSQHIQEDDFQNLELFLEYGKLATQDSSFKPFQSLMFLIRDWSYPYEHEYGLKGGQQYLRKKISLSNRHPQLQEVRENISSYFEDMCCYLMPHPGLEVATNPKFKGEISEISADFKKHISILVPLILSSKGLILKKIEGNCITGQEFITYFQAYTKLYSGNDLPEAKTVLQATVEASILLTVNKCVQIYKAEMSKNLNVGGSYVSYKRLEAFHDKNIQYALMKFDGFKKLGNRNVIQRHRIDLEDQIMSAFEDFKTKNENHQVVCNTKTPIVLLVLFVFSWFLGTFCNMFFLYPIANIFTYICYLSFTGLVIWSQVRYSGDNNFVNQVVDRICLTIWKEFFTFLAEQGYGSLANVLPVAINSLNSHN